ncbi:universal stress protein [Natronobiforma cellulositropha]|uniref:universal stress protein n=1 Tax=Natronobiforma cellulositropha TaxID=1679076 RepID=UPI0021D5D9EA|nr:universal stress protein [Natronobiforma cellulositropha]
MYRTVLVPTDGSETAARVVEQAFELATRFDATVYVLYVVDIEGAFPFGPPVDDAREAVYERARAVTDGIAADAPDGLEVVSVVDDGVAHETILEYAASQDVGLIVMGTHGGRGMDRFVLGSVTETIMQRADRSVLVSHAGEEDERVSTPGEARTLAASALEDEAAFEAEATLEEVRERGGFWLVHATDGERAYTAHVDRLSGAVTVTETE